MLSIAFLGKPGDPRTINPSDPPSDSGSILTLPLLTQLATFLTGSAYFGWLFRSQHYTDVDWPTATNLLSAIEAVPDEAIMVLSGTAANGETYIFGIFSPKPKLDGLSIQTNIIPNHYGQEPCALFQLAPVQDVFRGAIGMAGWVSEDGIAKFGNNLGVSLTLKDGLRSVEVVHQATDAERVGVFTANMRRGNWSVSFTINEMEIWSERKQ